MAILLSCLFGLLFGTPLALAAAAQAAISKGGLRQEGGAWLLYGMALARMNRWDKADEVLAHAKGYDYTERYAEQWLAYVKNERKHSAMLAAKS